MLYQSSFEEILYVLIGIGWIAWSIYKGTQKNKARQTNQEDDEPATEKKSVFETFIDNILVEEKPLPYSSGENYETFDDEIIAEEPAKQDGVFSYDDYYEEDNFESVTDVMKERMEARAKILETKKITIKDSHRTKKKPRFDLRKAVVYSEILNPRYF